MISFLPLAGSVVDTIGRTPMVELHKLRAKLKLEGRLLAKLEYFNPGFSKKDRIALEMIRGARARGDLRPGQTVVELTSGNTGTGLAIVCRALGHPFIAVMSKGNTIERARAARSPGFCVRSRSGIRRCADTWLSRHRLPRWLANRLQIRAT